jgi:hypothetical protein
MVHNDINMNATGGEDTIPCINPTAIMYNTASRSSACIDDTSPYPYQDILMYDAMEQPGVTIDDITDMGSQPYVKNGTDDGGSPANPKVIRCKLYFLVAAHKIVQTGKEFVAVARIPYGKTREEENPFVNAQGKAYHYVPEMRHRQFNTSIPLTATELAGAVCDDQAFVVHKEIGTSCAPAGTYLVYRLKRTEPGIRNLRFEATWDWGNGVTGIASYDFVALTAQDGCVSKDYSKINSPIVSFFIFSDALQRRFRKNS